FRPERAGPIWYHCSSSVPSPSGSRVKRQVADGCPGSPTAQAKRCGGSHSVTVLTLSPSPMAGWPLRPVHPWPTPGPGTPVRHAAAGDPAAAAPAIHVTGLRKRYGDVTALADVDLVIRAGEFFTLLGPSGSGKTTLLRLIAGFERPDAGRIELGGRDVTQVPPYARNVNTVFQDYALFPHMSVAQNIEYGLRVRRVAKAERRDSA